MMMWRVRRFVFTVFTLISTHRPCEIRVPFGGNKGLDANEYCIGDYQNSGDALKCTTLAQKAVARKKNATSCVASRS